MASIKRIGKDKFDIPIWEVVYRRTPGGKQIRKRFHLPDKTMVEREIQLDSQRSGINLKWSEGGKIYLEAKRLEGKGERSLENVERALQVFIEIMGDTGIEKTSPAAFKDFMQKAASRPVTHKYAGRIPRVSGPKVANHHRRELLAVANYLLWHTGKISIVPFEKVPPLPAAPIRREPLPHDLIPEYIEALPPYIMRPVMMVLYYGLRSTATCNLTPESVEDGFLSALDKGGVKRRIPIDATLGAILAEAMAFRETFKDPGSGLFLTVRGKSWDRTSLLHAAQKAWSKAGLEKKMIHEVRHTLGTLAGKSFSPGMVQAAMGHRSRKSSEVYFHPTEEMAAEVRQKIITTVSQEMGKTGIFGGEQATVGYTKNGEYSCPHCQRKFLIIKSKGRKP